MHRASLTEARNSRCRDALVRYAVILTLRPRILPERV